MKRFLLAVLSKEKLFCFCFSLILLLFTIPMWYSGKGKITIFTSLNEGTEFSIFYKNNQNNNYIELKGKVDKNGAASFTVKGLKLVWFKVVIQEKSAIINTQFDGLKSYILSLNDKNEYVGKALYNPICKPSKKNLYNFVVLSCFGCYIGLFFLYSIKIGVPRDNPKIPFFLNFEFLRIIFTLLIVILHIALFTPYKFYSMGRYGVEFFFILSGFLFSLTYKHYDSVFSFIKSKIIHFLPCIIFCSLFSGLFVRKLDISYLTADWFFWGNTIFNGDSYAGPAWYISVLFWVSLLFYYLLKTQRKENVNVIIGILTFFAYAACVRFGWGRYQGLGDKNNIGYAITQSLMRGLGGVGLGYFIGSCYLNRNNERKLFKTWHYTVAEIGFLILPLICMFNKKFFPTNVMLLVVCYSFLIYLFAIKRGHFSRLVDRPIFAKIGRYCFAIYISHTSISFIILHFLNNPIIIHSKIIGTILYACFCCFVGFLVHHLIELPISQALKKWLQ